MPPQRSRSNSSNGSAGKPRLFQCTGYGNCHMVFTRSEHLARHARKHTGEKPFKCIVPECNKMFSRFDNMMQHTQTHRTTAGNNNTATTTTIPAITASRPSSSSLQPATVFIRQRRHRSNTTGSIDQHPHQRHHQVLMPAVSLKSNTHERPHHHHQRLSIADLCNPTVIEEGQEGHGRQKMTTATVVVVGQNYKVTADELEVLQAFGRLSTTPDYFDSLRDLFTDSACVCL